MIRFFRRIRRALFSDNKYLKYALYALGEITLVMIGILLALQVNNWNEKRAIIAEEKVLLHLIQDELKENAKSLVGIKNLMANDVFKLERILSHLKDHQRYPDSILSDFAILTIGRGISYRLAAFQTLESKGIDMIKNIKLRQDVVDIYNVRLERILANFENFRNNQRLIFRPLFQSRFIYPENLPIDLNFRPTNFKALKSDLEFQNAVKTCRSNKVGIITRFEEAIEGVDQLIALIEQELSDN